MLRALLLSALALLASCGDPPGAGVSGAPARRIVSLSPALSASLVELGWTDRIVGRTPWCTDIDAVPVVGSLNEVDLERMDAVAPDLVLVQRTASGLPQGLAQAAGARGWRVVEIPCATLDDVVSLGPAIESAVGETSPAGTQAAAWRFALTPLEMAAKNSPAVLLFAADPPMAFGRDAYLAQAWQRWGGSTLPDVPGYPSLSLEDLASLHPKTVVFVGAAGASGALAEACAASGLRFIALDDARLLRPGPELRKALEAWRAQRMGGSP